MVTHDKTRCKGTACPIHNPSVHPMNTWPVALRAYGIADRVCTHGIKHPDPDSITYLDRRAPLIDFTKHRCDGCCGSPVPSGA